MRRIMSIAVLWGLTALPCCWGERQGGPSGIADCSDFECDNILTIYVTRRDEEPFVPGEYRFSIDDDDTVVSCAIRDEDDLACDGDTEDLEAVLSPNEDEFTLRWNKAPATLSIEIQRMWEDNSQVYGA